MIDKVLSLVSIIGPISFPFSKFHFPTNRDIGYLETPIEPIPESIWKDMPVELRQLVYFAKLCDTDISLDKDTVRIKLKQKRANLLGNSSLITALYNAKTGKYVGGSGAPLIYI